MSFVWNLLKAAFAILLLSAVTGVPVNVILWLSAGFVFLLAVVTIANWRRKKLDAYQPPSGDGQF